MKIKSILFILSYNAIDKVNKVTVMCLRCHLPFIYMVIEQLFI